MKRDRRNFIKLLMQAGVASPSFMLMSPSLSGNVQSVPVEAKYYEKLGEKKIKCNLCPHECRVADLERGTCGVRENRGGKYFTLVHSNPCAVNVDPIEKKPVFHYLPGTKSFSIATAGCNFVCKFCQNWEISQKRPEQVKSFTLSPAGVNMLAKKRGCRTVAHTYSEPVIFFEYMLDCAIEGKRRGIPNVMISNGFIQEKPMRELCKYLGAVKIDLKAFTEKFYKEFCSGSLRPVLDTLLVLKDEGIWFEIVDLIIPTLNDSDTEIKKMSKWIVKELGSDVPLHFSRYYPTFMLKNIPPTPPETVLKARKIALDSGVRFAYVGNMISDAENTYCPSCNKLLIERVGFHSSIKGMKKNKCKYCGEKIPGRFN
ncbi:MAG: AmmeMemoRadiSam system radical SAM enzyme [Acidobacteriota bacterium]